jgi:outer membrane protein assembly complex protein YaeT
MASRTALALPLCILLGVSSLGRTQDLAPPAAYEGKRIEQVRFEPESQPLSRADLERLVPFKPGNPLHLAESRDFIQRLYATGRYDYVEVAAEPSPNGVTVVIRTTDQWFAGPVEVAGKVKSPPSEGQLADASGLELGNPYEDDDLKSAVAGIRDLLQRNGLYRAAVVPEITRDSEHQQVNLRFRVDSGKRARFVLPVVFGDTRLPPEELAHTARLKGFWFLRWKQATAANLQHGLANIRQKYQKNDRLTASVMLDRLEYVPDENRVRPVIQAQGGPKIKITTAGAKVSKSKLAKYVPVVLQQTVNRDLLVRGVANLRDYFQNKGYFDVKVDYRTAQPAPDLQDVTYGIDLGERHKVVLVDIRGNRYFSTGDIRSRMFVQPASLLILRHGRYSTGFAARDRDAIKALYAGNGFRDAVVNLDAIDDYQGKKGDVAVVVNIDEGPQYLVGNLAVEGLDRPDRDQIISRLASSNGQPFSQTNVALDRDYLLGIYQSAGYPDVAFDWRMNNGPGPRQVSVRYIVRPGPVRFVRDVLITGTRVSSNRMISPIVQLKPGDPLSWTRMGEMQRNFYNLGVFDRVNMAIQNQQGETQNKYVVYQLSEGHRYYAAVGFGAEIARIGGSSSSLNNPAGTTGFAPRGDLNVTRTNMFGLGHSLIFRSRYSTLDRRVSLEYLAPRFHNIEGRNISVTALYDNTRDVLTYNARRYEGSAFVTQQFSKATHARFGYTWRNVRVDQSTLKINPLLIPQQSQPARLAMLRANVVQDRRDDPADAHRGIYNTADLSVVEHYFGGNKNFLRFLGQNSLYKTVLSHLVIASNTKLGIIKPFSVTAGITPFDYIPIAERFFGGGSFDNRGFNDFQAGPRDLLTGFPLGGNALFSHQTELRFPLIGDNINGVLFHDFGNIFKDAGSISFRVHQKNIQDFDYMVHAVGFGIRYKTPVGPVRVDLAYSMNPPTFFGLKGTYQQLLFGGATPQIQSISHFQFFISIGQAF